MAINENWNIRSRAHACSHTAQPFKDGEVFMTVLVEDPKTGELLRRDYSLAAWPEVEPGLGNSFSVWRSEYEAVKTESRPEIAEKESAEVLLRRLIEEDSILTENTRYILAVMLERKKQLKQTGTRETEDDTFLVYEHPKSGEVYIIRDPELKLAQIEEVQKEVSRLLSGEKPAEPASPDSNAAAEPAPATAAEPTPAEPADAPASAEGDSQATDAEPLIKPDAEPVAATEPELESSPEPEPEPEPDTSTEAELAGETDTASELEPELEQEEPAEDGPITEYDLDEASAEPAEESHHPTTS